MRKWGFHSRSYLFALVVLAFVGPQESRVSATPTAPMDECEGDFITIVNPCECDEVACAAIIHITATPSSDCAGCKFVSDIVINCGEGSTCNYDDDSTIGLKCASSEKLMLSCPGNPQQNMVEVLLLCGACF